VAPATGPANLLGIIDWHATILPYFISALMPPAIVYYGDKILIRSVWDGSLPGPLPANLEEFSPDEQAEYRYSFGWQIDTNGRPGSILVDERLSPLPHVHETHDASH